MYRIVETMYSHVQPFKSGPLASMLLRITIAQMNLVSAMRVCSWRSAWNSHVSGLRRCDERTCINKSLFQRLQSSPVLLLVSHLLNCFADIFSVFSAYYFTIFHPTYCSVNLSTFSCGDLMSAGLANAYMDSQ